MSVTTPTGPSVPYEGEPQSESPVTDQDYDPFAVDTNDIVVLKGPRAWHYTGGLEPINLRAVFGDENKPYVPEGQLPEDHEWSVETDPSTGNKVLAPKPKLSNEDSHAYRIDGQNPPPAPTGWHYKGSGERRNGFVVWELIKDEPSLEV